jgi:putative heme iron utilization protein
MVIFSIFSEKKKEYIKKQNEYDFFVNNNFTGTYIYRKTPARKFRNIKKYVV